MTWVTGGRGLYEALERLTVGYDPMVLGFHPYRLGGYIVDVAYSPGMLMYGLSAVPGIRITQIDEEDS